MNQTKKISDQLIGQIRTDSELTGPSKWLGSPKFTFDKDLATPGEVIGLLHKEYVFSKIPYDFRVIRRVVYEETIVQD